jgi:hypothetical protein
MRVCSIMPPASDLQLHLWPHSSAPFVFDGQVELLAPGGFDVTHSTVRTNLDVQLLGLLCATAEPALKGTAHLRDRDADDRHVIMTGSSQVEGAGLGDVPSLCPSLWWNPGPTQKLNRKWCTSEIHNKCLWKGTWKSKREKGLSFH